MWLATYLPTFYYRDAYFSTSLTTFSYPVAYISTFPLPTQRQPVTGARASPAPSDPWRRWGILGMRCDG